MLGCCAPESEGSGEGVTDAGLGSWALLDHRGEVKLAGPAAAEYEGTRSPGQRSPRLSPS
jgi:hypothetical protein